MEAGKLPENKHVPKCSFRCRYNITKCWKRFINELRFLQSFTFNINLSPPAKSTIHRWLLVLCPSIKFTPFTVTRNKLQNNNGVVISTTTSINQYISWIVWIHRSKKLFTCYYMWYNIKYIPRKNKPRKESRVHFYQRERLLSSLALVDPTDLARLPDLSKSHTSSVPVTRVSTSPGTSCVPSAVCFISNLHACKKTKISSNFVHVTQFHIVRL